jgi:parvulin-like peptidyl-prolyl isomerase
LFLFSCNKPVVLNDETVAIVGENSITVNKYKQRYQDYLFVTGIKDNLLLRKQILQNMINEKLLKKYDDNSNIYSNPEYKKEIDWTKKQMVLAYLKDQEIYAKIDVSESEIRQAFIRVNESIAARHLYASTEEEAYRLYNQLKNGADFELLAKNVFTDSTLKSNGGYLGYFTWGDMDPAFEQAAYGLKVGEISEPVKTEYGYSIIKLEYRKPHPLLTESEFIRKKSKLERLLKINKKKSYEKNYVNKYFSNEKLKFYDSGLFICLKMLSKDNLENIEDVDKNSLSTQCTEYDGQIFTALDIKNIIKKMPAYYRQRINSVETLKHAIEGIIKQENLLYIASQKGFDRAEPVIDKFQKASNNIFLKYKRREITDKTFIPDTILYDYYKENIVHFSTEEELSLQEILIDDKTLALDIKGQLLAGADFGELAQKYSLRKWSAKNKGIIGYAPLRKFGKLKNKLWKNSVNQIIGPIEIEDYFGIFKILGKKERNPIDLEKIKPEVIKEIHKTNETQYVRSYLDQLQQDVNIQINQDLIFAMKFSNK